MCPEGYTGVFCETKVIGKVFMKIKIIFFINIFSVTATTTTTSAPSTTLCANQNYCQNSGVCYLVNGVNRCICPEGKKKFIVLTIQTLQIYNFNI